MIVLRWIHALQWQQLRVEKCRCTMRTSCGSVSCRYTKKTDVETRQQAVLAIKPWSNVDWTNTENLIVESVLSIKRNKTWQILTQPVRITTYVASGRWMYVPLCCASPIMYYSCASHP